MSVTLAESLSGLAAHLKCTLTPVEHAMLAQFGALVAQWNRKVNLTAARAEEHLAEVLFADALILRHQDLIGEAQTVVDVGTGAGAPALPLAVLRPDLRMYCVEPLRKRVAFLRTAVGTLQLGARIRIVEARSDQLSGVPRADVAMSRATFEPAAWATLGASLAGTVLVLTAREDPPDVPGLYPQTARRYTVPRTGAARCITAYRRRGADGPG